MTNLRSITAAFAMTAALALPAFAQTGTTGNTAGTTAPGATMSGTTMAPGVPARPLAATTSGAVTDTGRSTYMTADSSVRASKVIGASVYNDRDQKIGTVDELLMNASHDVTQAVLSVGGFLGIDSKLVAVKIDQLQVHADRIVLGGATKDDLTRMPTYKYTKAAS